MSIVHIFVIVMVVLGVGHPQILVYLAHQPAVIAGIRHTALRGDRLPLGGTAQVRGERGAGTNEGDNERRLGIARDGEREQWRVVNLRHSCA